MPLRSIPLLAALVALALVSRAATPALPEDAPTPAQAIERAADTIQHVAGARRLLLLGELHGTREVPQLAAALVERYAAEGPVLLAVEIPHAEQAAITAHVRSGTPATRAALLARPFWSPADTAHDGRRNEDLVELVDHVGRLRGAGHDVAVLAFDVPATPGHHARDRGMATVLRAAHAALPHGRMLVVTGNVHAMRRRPPNAPAMMQVPAGAWLHDLDPVSFRISARSGSFWACRQRCGPVPADGVHMRTGPATGEYDHVVVLPRHHVARLLGSK